MIVGKLNFSEFQGFVVSLKEWNRLEVEDSLSGAILVFALNNHIIVS